MTLIVGIKCSDGVVLASDSAATYAQGIQFTIGQQTVQKVHQIGDQLLYASTGAIGPSQLIRQALEKMAPSRGTRSRNRPPRSWHSSRTSSASRSGN